MKIPALLLLAGLASAPFLRTQETQEVKKPHPVTGFAQQEAERLTKEIEGSWILVDYKDPDDPAFEGALDGFATFHEGFLTLMMQLEAVEPHWFGARDALFLQAGSYRYRFDEKADLQTAVVMGFTNLTDTGDLDTLPTEEAHEYLVQLADGVLELRTVDQVQMTFRKVEAGDFPEKAIRRLQKQRGGQPAWEPDHGDD